MRFTVHAVRGAAIVLLTLGVFASTVGAQERLGGPSPWVIDEKDPVSSVPSPEEAIKMPMEMGYLVIELIERGEKEAKRGNFVQSARYYLAVAKAGPDKAIGFSKACEAYEKAEAWGPAMDACKHALGREGVTGPDFLRYLRVALKRGNLSPEEVADVDAVLTNLEGKVEAAVVTNFRCRLAVTTEEPARLASCAETVAAWPKEDPMRLTFLTLDAIARHDFDDARDALGEAEQAGAPADLLARTREQIARSEAAYEAEHGFFDRYGRVILIVVILGLLAALVIVNWRRKPSEPQPAA